ncbi:MAG: NAD(P)/FAD-dependent oxidoreductase, partial [Blastocatellia bacterium]
EGRRLERELRGAIRVDWGGSVEWYPPGSEASVHQREVARHRQWGYPTRLVDAATLQRLLPGVRPGSIGAASFSSEEGTVDPVEVVQALLAQAQAYGARLLDACAVTGWLFAGEGGTGRIRRVRGVQTTQGEIDGEVVVLAAGTGIPTMAGLAGVQVPLVESPGLLLHLRPEGRLVDRVVLAPGVHLLQRRDGRLITGSGFGGTPSNDQSPAQIERMRAAAVPLLPSLRDAQFERLTLGWRVMPQDELPILGFPHSLPNVYLAAMHSGITLAPLIGRLVATEILDRIPIDLLAPFRIERFSRVAGH